MNCIKFYVPATDSKATESIPSQTFFVPWRYQKIDEKLERKTFFISNSSSGVLMGKIRHFVCNRKKVKKISIEKVLCSHKISIRVNGSLRFFKLHS